VSHPRPCSRWLALLAAVALTASACGDDGDDGNDGAGSGGEAAAGGSPTGSGGEATGGTTGAGGAGAVATCKALCGFAPVSQEIAGCVGRFVVDRQPAVAGVITCQTANESPEACEACYAGAAVPDAVCAEAHTTCF
jgi:hypothetical protein